MIDDNFEKKINKLPNHISDFLSSVEAVDVIIKIVKKNKFERFKLKELNDIIYRTVFKEAAIENMRDEIKKKLNSSDEDSKEITLIILTEIFYPIKDYFPGIEDEILKLGGEIPKEKPKKLTEQLLKREEEMERMAEIEKEKERERMSDTIILKPIEVLIKKYPIVGEQQISSRKSIELKSMPIPMKPLVKFWMKDYKEKMGYYQHSNLERVQYVYHDKNTKNMNEEERRQLNLILKSVDEKIFLPYSTRMKKIDFSKMNEE